MAGQKFPALSPNTGSASRSDPREFKSSRFESQVNGIKTWGLGMGDHECLGKAAERTIDRLDELLDLFKLDDVRELVMDAMERSTDPVATTGMFDAVIAAIEQESTPALMRIAARLILMSGETAYVQQH